MSAKESLKVQREWFAWFLVAGVARLATLQYSSIDHDESTYLIIAQQWLGGHLPWTEFLDIKPIGIYALFAGALGLFGEHVFVARVLAIFFISLTALLIVRVLGLAKLSTWQSRAGGLLFIVSISIHQWSWASNTEIFFVFFTALGFWLWLRFASRSIYLLVGLSFGLGFCIKYHVAFDLAALGLVHLITAKRQDLLRRIIDLICIGIGFALPIVTWLALYFIMDESAVLHEVLIDIPSRYSVRASVLESLNFVAEFYLVFLPISLLFFLALWKSITRVARGQSDRFLWLAIIWPMLTWMAIMLTGKLFFHYYIQQVLPLVVIASLSLPHVLLGWQKSISSKPWGLALAAVLILTPAVHQYLILYGKQDVGRAAAKIMIQELNEEDVIFANTDHIVYFLCKKPPPTRFVHSSVFHKPSLQASFGMNLEAELASISAKSPRYCLVKKEKDLATQKLLSGYQLISTFRGGVELWGI